MVRSIAWLMVFVLAGVLVGYFAATLGDAGWLLIAAFIASIWLAPRLYVSYRMPTVMGKRLRSLEVDPSFSPPPGAEPAESDLLDRLHRTGETDDWSGFEALLADDFTLVDARGRRYAKKRYMAIEKTIARAYPDMKSTHEHTLADPFDPNVFWVLSHQLGHPRRGPAYDVSVWGRYTVTPDHRLLREIESAAVIRVG
jgi:hypothetical protein